MHVTHLDIPGQLISHGDQFMVFVPDGEPYSDRRVTIERPSLRIYGDEDDNCIWVQGEVPVVTAGGDKLFKRADWSFYPIKP